MDIKVGKKRLGKSRIDRGMSSAKVDDSMTGLFGFFHGRGEYDTNEIVDSEDLGRETMNVDERRRALTDAGRHEMDSSQSNLLKKSLSLLISR